jgi:hypothetical protein
MLHLSRLKVVKSIKTLTDKNKQVILRLSGPIPRGGTDVKNPVASQPPQGMGDAGAPADAKANFLLLKPGGTTASSSCQAEAPPQDILQGDQEVIHQTSPQLRFDPMREWRARRTASKPPLRYERRTTLLRQIKPPKGSESAN